ncbi:MAG TPA: cytochrome c, partial [Gemmatimonadales bacterium]|nr:cytochrome c [Gemmatimonadales bacterium]
AEAGKALFESKCSACHKMSERYVGPALGEVTVRRTPAYIMNMVLNPEEMYTRHPVAHQLLAELMTQMPNLGLTRDQARQIVEYLRTQAPAKAAS